MMRRLVALLALTVPPAFSQVRFEVASIRPSRPGVGPRDSRIKIHADRFDVEAATVGDILDMLNEWQLYRVTGGPAWMRDDRFDIHAKAGAEISSDQRKAAMMALLTDRFGLVSHVEIRDVPGIVLLAPKKPAGLKPVADGESYAMRFGANHDPTFTAVPMSAFINYLSQMWHSPVVDQTGLNGLFDFSLQPSAIDPQPGDFWGDRVREAVTAFGFEVETRKVKLEITVVDRCDRPRD